MNSYILILDNKIIHMDDRIGYTTTGETEINQDKQQITEQKHNFCLRDDLVIDAFLDPLTIVRGAYQIRHAASVCWISRV